jgi:hypothetical protein
MVLQQARGQRVVCVIDVDGELPRWCYERSGSVAGGDK